MIIVYKEQQSKNALRVLLFSPFGGCKNFMASVRLTKNFTERGKK